MGRCLRCAPSSRRPAGTSAALYKSMRRRVGISEFDRGSCCSELAQQQFLPQHLPVSLQQHFAIGACCPFAAQAPPHRRVHIPVRPTLTISSGMMAKRIVPVKWNIRFVYSESENDSELASLIFDFPKRDLSVNREFSDLLARSEEGCERSRSL